MTARAIALLLLLSACGGSTSTASPVTGDAGATGDATSSNDAAAPGDGGTASDAVVPDDAPPVSCPVLGPDAGLYAYDNVASGTIDGAGVSCQMCNAGATVVVQSYATSPTMTYLRIFGGTLTFQDPTTASDAFLDVLVQIGGAAPGVYTSTDAQNCGNMILSYALPIPPGVDCDGGVAPSCPPGCSSACSGQGCSPCTPSQPTVGYSSQGAATCFEVAQPAVGSWSATLTSVAPYTGDAGLSQGRVYYTAHGTLTAQLVGGDADAGSQTATLSLTF